MSRVYFMGALLGLVPARSAAQEYGAQATVAREGLVSTHGEDATAAGSTLNLVDRISLPQALGDVVREAPGTAQQRSGGLGAFSAVSLRGADFNETLVMLDEIPLVTPDGGAFDLSLFPALLFERVDVFRGGAPVWLGSGAIGGVLRLVPRRDAQQTLRGALAAGSFGTYQLSAGASVRSDQDATVQSQIVLRSAQNNFPYTDDKGTRFDASDDEELHRNNHELTDASGYLDVRLPLHKGSLHVVALAEGRTAGFPGPASAPTPNIHRQSVKGILGAAFERRAGGGNARPRRRVQLVVAGSYDFSRYSDPYGELGLSQRFQTHDQAYRWFVRAAGTLRLTNWLESTLVSTYALDYYDWYNRYAFPRAAPSTRHTGAAALELFAHKKLGPLALELRPSVRGEWSRTVLHAQRGLSGAFAASNTQWIPTARLGVGLGLFDDFALTASASTGARLPTLFELFGDRALVLPTADLKPVTSVTYDAGLVHRSERAHFSSSSELRAFWLRRRDAIALFRTSQFQAGHENLSQVELKGVEAAWNTRWFERFSCFGALTYLDSQSPLERLNPETGNFEALNKRLTFKPRWVASLRPEFRLPFSQRLLSSVGISSEFYYRSFVFVDRANLAVTNECRTVALAATLGFWHERFALSGRMDDVTDARCTDLLGYPLPGRALFFTLSYREELHDQA